MAEHCTLLCNAFLIHILFSAIWNTGVFVAEGGEYSVLTKCGHSNFPWCNNHSRLKDPGEDRTHLFGSSACSKIRTVESHNLLFCRVHFWRIWEYLEVCRWVLSESTQRLHTQTFVRIQIFFSHLPRLLESNWHTGDQNLAANLAQNVKWQGSSMFWASHFSWIDLSKLFHCGCSHQILGGKLHKIEVKHSTVKCNTTPQCFTKTVIVEDKKIVWTRK